MLSIQIKCTLKNVHLKSLKKLNEKRNISRNYTNGVERDQTKLKLSANALPNGVVKVSISPEDTLYGRMPVDLCCVLDNSASMSEAALIQNENGRSESFGLTVLDIVKHATKTVTANLTDYDQMSLVTFSEQALTRFMQLKMSDTMKIKANSSIDDIRVDARTNLWDGLRTGFDYTEPTPGRHSAIMLLTDGCPNVHPPRGHIPMLERELVRRNFTGSIATFGFGYQLDSPLLDEIAEKGNGLYSFIPDSSFVGTVFVHTISNLLSILASDVKMVLTPLNGAKFKDSPAYYSHSNLPDGSIGLSVGPIQAGQDRDFIFNMELPSDPHLPYLKVDLDYDTAECRKQISAVGTRDRDANIHIHLLRMKIISRIKTLIAQMTEGYHQEIIKSLEDLIQDIESTDQYNDPLISGILEDLKGQVREAFSRPDWYYKWGRHYLPSLLRAHFNQQRNNFKDPGVQIYGGSLFQEEIDKADEIFLKMPAPIPSGRATNLKVNINMSKYHSSNNPCFDGDCDVLISDKTLKKVCQIQKGDFVVTSTGEIATVLCVVKTNIADKTPLVHLESGLIITPWHPVRINGKWDFPCNITPAIESQCNAVFSFVLSSGHIMIINDIQCVTLGHNFTEDIVSHPFFGTQKVIENLKQLNGWDSGLINLKEGCLLKDQSTGLAYKLVQ